MAVAPAAVTLSAFAEDGFDVAEFVAQYRPALRSAGAINRLRHDVATILSDLHQELIELINRDYADFVNVSTTLAGVDAQIQGIVVPLAAIRDSVNDVRARFSDHVAKMEAMLAERAEIREKKALLQTMLQISDTVAKAEELLQVDSGRADEGVAPMTERIASMYNELQFHASQGKGLPFVAMMEPGGSGAAGGQRINRIAETLQRTLEAGFVEGVRNNDTERLTQCLRTYALIDKARQAEALYRQAVVAPFVAKTITMENLEALATSPPRSRGEALAALYGEVLSFVRLDRASVLAITRNVLRGAGYDLLVNAWGVRAAAVWPEVASTIGKNLMSIFNAGIPAQFHQYYRATIAFVADYERLIGTPASVAALRAHPAYVEFLQRWHQRQLPVYYQIRFKEIAAAVEDVVGAAKLDASRRAPAAPSEFALAGTAAIAAALERCWHDDVFLYGLAHRFWRLTFQLLARFEAWREAVLPALAASKATTPAAPASTAPTELVVALYTDTEALCAKVRALFDENIAPHLPVAASALGPFRASLDEAVERLRACLPELAAVLTQAIGAQASEPLSAVRGITTLYRMTNRESPTTALPYVKDAAAPLTSFAQGAGRQLPSDVCQSILEQAMRQAHGRYLTLTTELLNTLKKTEDSLQRLKRTKKKAAGDEAAAADGAAGGAAPGTMTDEAKIRQQLWLDVRQYTSELRQAGLDPDAQPLLVELSKLVDPASAATPVPPRSGTPATPRVPASGLPDDALAASGSLPPEAAAAPPPPS